MKHFKKIILFLIVTAMALAMTACKTEQTDITFVLDWTPNTNHTGLYVAMEKGYFSKAGLNVKIVQPPEDGAEMMVGAGQAQFGISFQDTMAHALVGENELPITAVAAVIQHNTSGILSRKGEGMDTPKGLEGKRYATWDLPIEKATIKQVMENEGGDFSKVELIPSTVTDEVSALKSKSVDAIWVYSAWGKAACDIVNLPTDYFAFRDIDPVFDYYTPVVIANNSFLEEDPETAKAFMAALSKGYEYASANPKAAADILMESVPELKSNPLLIYASQNELAKEYQADAPRWGEIDKGRWSGFYGWLNQYDLLEDPILADKGFTNEFLPEVVNE